MWHFLRLTILPKKFKILPLVLNLDYVRHFAVNIEKEFIIRMLDKIKGSDELSVVFVSR